jgi:hypothetical protein
MQRDPDCVKWKHRGAELVREQLKGKSREEQLSWWAEQARQLRELQQRSQERDRKKSA